MRKVFSGMVIGALTGAGIALWVDVLRGNGDANRTEKTVIGGALVGAAIGGVGVGITNFKRDIKAEIVKDISAKVEKEIFANLNFADVENDIKVKADKEIDKAVKVINDVAKKKIDKAVVEINKQNVADIDAKVSKRLADVEANMVVFKKDLKSIRELAANKQTNVLLGGGQPQGTNKYDIIQSMVDSGEYTANEIKGIMEKL